jgi:hypothetical protein
MEDLPVDPESGRIVEPCGSVTPATKPEDTRMSKQRSRYSLLLSQGFNPSTGLIEGSRNHVRPELAVNGDSSWWSLCLQLIEPDAVYDFASALAEAGLPALNGMRSLLVGHGTDQLDAALDKLKAFLPLTA